MGEPASRRPIDLRVIRLALAACAATSLGDASAEAFDVVGQCRYGVPNGAYELRMPDGALRVAGAFSQGRMTGTFIFWSAGGARLAVLPLDNDARSGTVALWYTAPDGRSETGQKLEAPYVDDRPQGVKRSWYANGARRAEVRYEQGAVLEARGWTPEGTALAEEDARALAARDAETDEQTYASLRAVVRDHLPVCEPSTPNGEPPRS